MRSSTERSISLSDPSLETEKCDESLLPNAATVMHPASEKPVDMIITVFFKDDIQINKENPIVPELDGSLEADVDADLVDVKAGALDDRAVEAVAGEIDWGGPLLCQVCSRSSFLWNCPLWYWRVQLSCRHLVWRPGRWLQALPIQLGFLQAF